MRSFAGVSILLLASAAVALAQQQEQKLVDRLLKPDTTLANSAQNKKFVAAGVSLDKKASVKTFYVQDKGKAKAFSNTHSFSTDRFNSNSFYAGRDHTTVSTQTAVDTQKIYPTWIANASGRFHDSDKRVTTQNYSGNRPFLDHGKSEKSLQRQNAPMTIDQVRELLNKNK